MKYDDYIDQILDAQKHIYGKCTRTDVRQLHWLNQLGGYNVVGKFENQQITGSFKYRGAFNFMRQQPHNKPIIAASAGNHALAVAEAGKRFNIKTTICIPTTASSVKKNRLAAYPHSLIPEGASLEDSCQYAQNLAIEKDWSYVSPYNNSKIIQGQGTVGLEFLEQVPDIDTLVVPVGGGGLISGIALIAKKIKPLIKIIGVEPDTYNTFSILKKTNKLVDTPNSPTFADGLAVNLERNSLTPDIIQKYVDEIVTVSEEEIAAGVLAMLYHESQLIEGGGAAGIAAIIAGKIDKSNGKIGVVLSGGNVTVSNLSKIINYPFTNEKLLDYINVYGEKASHKIALRGIDFSESTNKIAAKKRSNSQLIDIEEDITYYSERFADAESKISKYKILFDDYVEYCKNKCIRTDQAAIDTFLSIHKIARQKLENIDITSIKNIKHPSAYNDKITQFIQEYRALLHLVMSLSLVLDWRSASYNQSVDSMFFGINSQDNPGVNYNRYESDRLVSLEKELAQTLGLNQEKAGVLMTSSGMAAYTLMESYMIRYILEPGDTVLIPQYLYFESDEQISSIKSINVIKADTHKPDEIVDLIKKYNPKLILIDPITNTVDLRMTDIYKVVKKTARLKLNHDIFFAIDGSLMSGEIDINELMNNGNKNVKIIYYDSCSKYLQLGLDIAMGGLVAFPVDLTAIFDRLRRNTGTILYDFAANIFPHYSRKIQKHRMQRFSRNAILVGEIVGKSDISKQVTANYPMLRDHVDYKTAIKFQSVGGLITFSFKDETLNQRESLNSLIEIVLHTAKNNGLSITKGVSFGFSIPRISAAAAMAENAGPFLRLSVGDRSYQETILLGKTIIQSFERYLSINNNSKDAQSSNRGLDPTLIDNIFFVNPTDVKNNRKKYSSLQAKILSKCYGNDYPGTSLDKNKNESQMSLNTQKTVFWAITENEKNSELLGTSSMIDASHEFGEGFAEMGKSGSMGLGGAKYGYGRFLSEWTKGSYGLDIFSSLITTVRNCPERPGKLGSVKGGIAIRIMFLKYFEFEQWGIAPWYLMPDDSDGSYEILDLLCRFRDKTANIDYVKDEEIAIIKNCQKILTNFIQQNYKLLPKYTTKNSDEILSWEIIPPSHKPDKNPLFMLPKSDGINFKQALGTINTSEHATAVIVLPLTPSTLNDQQFLDKNGWILTGFIPGRKNGSKSTPYKGMWTRLNSSRPIINPEYLSEPDTLSANWYFNWVKRTINKLK